MREVKVLFFTADPRLGRPGGESLDLDEDLREIKRRVREARFGHLLHFDPHGAARVDDLIDFLENTDAQIVHFSGHGGNEGLVLVAPDGSGTHPVDAAGLKRLFRNYRGAVRLAVLSACSSHAEAQAIADVVGCAIGTLSKIGDDAAITFNSRFYQAIANGHSVDWAHEKACTALQAHRIPKREYPQIFVRNPSIDPADVVFFKTVKLVPIRVAAAVAACVLTAAATVWEPSVPREPTVSDIACGSDAPEGMRSLMESRGAAPTTPAAPDGPAAALANGKALYAARKYAAAALAFEEAATAGSGEARGCLGYMYMYGRGMDPQPTTGFDLVHTAATQDRDPHAMYALAHAYLAGVGTTARQHLARDWFEKAAIQKYAEAMRSLGDLYRQEMNDSSYQHALLWYRRAVDHGAVDAMVDLGMMYEFGWGVQRNPAAALQSYRSAARAGSLRGMWAVGQSYEKGVGVPQDYVQAMVWYRKAARAGCAHAMNSIGVLYDNGWGVRKSAAKAKRWYKRAEKAGSELAKGNLGTFARD